MSNREVIADANPYTFIKANIPLKEAFERYFGYTDSETSSGRLDGCPGHAGDTCGGGNNSGSHTLQLYEYEGDDPGLEGTFTYNCHKCDAHGTVIDLYCQYATLDEKLESLDPGEDSLEACKGLAKDWKLELTNNGGNVLQRLLNDASDFYHQQLLDETKRYPECDNLTPLDYQLTVRKHTLQTLKDFKVGWTMGGRSLTDYLEGLGYDYDLVAKAGLIAKPKGGRGAFRDVLWVSHSFVYPFIYRRDTTRIRSKSTGLNGTEKKTTQIKKEFWGKRSEFYNIKDLYKFEKIILVEGENDVMSVVESDWEHGVIGTCGPLTKTQKNLLQLIALESSRPVTFLSGFDSDDAGDKYRASLSSLCSSLSQDEVSHIVVDPEVNDIDKYLKDGGTIAKALESFVVTGSAQLSEEGVVAEANSPIVEKDGGYYRRKEGKDGEMYYDQVSDFLIRMPFMYLRKGTRIRQVKVSKLKGPWMSTTIDSAQKVTLKAFEKEMTEVVDGTWWGSEKDLKEVWRFIEMRTPGKNVHIKDYCGHVQDKEVDIWLFGNCAVERGGKIITCAAEDDGIFWIGNGAAGGFGIKPTSQLEGTQSSMDAGIPSVRILRREEDYVKFTAKYLQAFNENFQNNKTLTLILNGWAMSSAYSNMVFKELGEFPVLCLWGKYGRGKTTVTKWLQSLYGMQECGATTVANLRSGVGMERKASYYASLPISVDEVRNDKVTKEHFAKFRGWYNRSARAMGAKDDPSKIVQVDVRSTFMLTGEDLPSDSALRSRLIPLKLPMSSSKSDRQYHWLNSASENKQLTSVGLNWVVEGMKQDPLEYSTERREIGEMLMKHGCSSRTANVWSVVYLHARKLRDLYFPEHTALEKELIQAIQSDTGEQKETDTLVEYWEAILAELSKERSDITEEHIIIQGGEIFLWTSYVHGVMTKRYREESKEILTHTAMVDMMKETPYFVKHGRLVLSNHSRKNGVMLNLEKAPPEVQGFLEYLTAPAGLSDADVSASPHDKHVSTDLET